MEQSVRDENLKKFKNKDCNIMLVTDLAARGIDIPKLENVINYNFPDKPKLFIHRIGRTGRAGNGGVAISFCSKDEHGYWKDIQKLIKVDVKTVSDHPYPWHSGNPETAPGGSTKPRNSNRSGEGHKSRKSANSKQNKKRWY